MKNAIRIFALVIVAAGAVASHAAANGTVSASHPAPGTPTPTCNPFTMQCGTIR
jgi:hypothetical protein